MSESRQWEPRRRARRRALQALYQWQITGQDIGEIIAQFKQEQDFSSVDEDLFQQISRGAVESYPALEAGLVEYMDRPLAKCDVMERIILVMGAWQLENDPGLPMQVLLDESIELAHKFGSDQSHLYVNGVLDKAARGWPRQVPGI